MFTPGQTSVFTDAFDIQEHFGWTVSSHFPMNEIKNNQTVKAFSSRLLTGCCGASLSILKTCATFPLALRCILKPGMAQRVARLMILYSKEAKSSACVCNNTGNPLRWLHSPRNLKSSVSIGRNFLNRFYWSMGRKIHRQLEYQQNRWWKSENKQSEEGQTGRKQEYKCSF